MLNRLVSLAAAALAISAVSASAAQPAKPGSRPTIILVHGAFAESGSWDPVVRHLLRDGYRVIAAANPLRSLNGDSDYVAMLAKATPGKVLLVGHSYGGEVISEAASAAPNVTGLVFVSGVAPDIGESAASLGDRFPGSTLGETLSAPVPQSDGTKDVYIEPTKFWHQFAADIPKAQAELMAVGQRPITQEALSEGALSPSWKRLPSWFVFGSEDRNIPRTEHVFMAKRANARETIEVKGASHVVMISHPAEVARLIERAANSP